MENSVENRLGWILIRKFMFKDSVEERLKAPLACVLTHIPHRKWKKSTKPASLWSDLTKKMCGRAYLLIKNEVYFSCICLV